MPIKTGIIKRYCIESGDNDSFSSLPGFEHFCTKKPWETDICVNFNQSVKGGLYDLFKLQNR